jgi:two-component system, OmpR family, sensor histidine kinase VicK
MINKAPWTMVKCTSTDFEIISKPNTVIETTVKTISEANGTFDYCLDSKGLSYFMDCEPIWNSIITLKNKEIKLRLVTEITTKNVRDSNLNMKYSNVFHSDKIKGNFLIVDGTKYLCFLMDENESTGQQLVKQLFCTQLKPFVDSQQYLFDNLCSHSIPAKERIREIGRGINGDFVDIIRTPSEIHKIAMELVDSSTYEILLLFSTTNAFYRAEYSGMLNSVWEASQRGVIVKMLIQGNRENNRLKEMVQRVIYQRNLPVNLQYIAKPLEAKISTLVIDQAISLAIEINDDSKMTFEDSTGIAIYSNNESKISSSLTIFETLWIQSEIDIQNKVKQAYFQMFKGFELRDEFYTRRWSFEQQRTKRDKLRKE